MSRITGSEVKNLMEAYGDVYSDQDMVDEQSQVLGKRGNDWYAVTKDPSGKKTGEKKLDPSEVGPNNRARYAQLRKDADTAAKPVRASSATLNSLNDPKTQNLFAQDNKPTEKPTEKPVPSKPSGPVLSKKNGVEGTGVGKDFKEKTWSDAEKSRYATVAAKVTPTPTKPATGMLGKTSFERRTPTSAEFKAAARERSGGEKSPEKILQAAKLAGQTQKSNNILASGKVAALGNKSTVQGTQQQVKADNIIKSGAVAALKPATPSVATAAAPKPKPVIPTRMPLAQSFEYDAYDLVLEYLLNNGHVDTLDEALYVMMEMDAEMIGDIVEARMDPRGRPASGPMNVYAKSKGKPDQAHLDAVKAYDEKQKKKTPEQRKKELDDYKERQRNR